MITVYSADGCVRCDATKRQLAKAGLEFTEMNVAHRPEVADALKHEGFTQLPVVNVDTDTIRTRWSGFQPDKIKQLVAMMSNASQIRNTRTDIRSLIEATTAQARTVHSATKDEASVVCVTRG